MSEKRPIACFQKGKEIETYYRTARNLLQGLRNQSLVQNDNLKSHWISQSNCFWYLRYNKLQKECSNCNDNGVSGNKIGQEYRLVDVERLSNSPLFDHAALAESLGHATGHRIGANSLPIDGVVVSLAPLFIKFSAFGQHWRFDCESRVCAVVKPSGVETAFNEILSPDGKRIAFTRNSNLWVRDVASGDERALIDDGEEFNCYGACSSAVGVASPALNVQWSPDSQKLLTVQRDSRDVKTSPIVNHLPAGSQLRPLVNHVKVAYPGDEELEYYRLLSINVVNGETVGFDYPKLVAGSDDSGFFTTERRAWWASDSQRAYFIAYEDAEYQVLRLVEVDTQSGSTRILIEERADTFVNLRPEYMDLLQHRYLEDSQEVVWWSQRTGYGHLYLYDLNTGELKQPITKGDWVVRNVLHVDNSRRELLIQTAGRIQGRNPYYRDICRVHIDTGELTPLISTEDEYSVHSVYDRGPPKYLGVSPKVDFIVATRSRVDKAPVNLLLNRDGGILLTLETADISNLPNGWQWPEPVKMRAADNKTDIYGLLFRPSHFLGDKRYPIINMIVGGPWLCAVPHGSFHNSRGGYADRHYFHAAALAELGFIVVVIDGRGTPLRSKAFQDISYGWLPDGAKTDDHKYAIEQLANRYPEIDLDRVGIYAPTGYHGAIQNLFECPDFYHVGVINNLMDSRLASRTVEHSDKYQGVNGPVESKRYPEQQVDDWNGKLLLLQNMCGLLASVYPPAGALRLIDSLQKVNKDVDLVVTPYSDGLMTSYAQRRAWDYLVTHLLGEKTPKEFDLGDFSF